MQITVNGETMETPKEITVSELLERLGSVQRRVAVERNGEIVPCSEHPAHRLSDGDRIEIVHAIGGG